MIQVRFSNGYVVRYPQATFVKILPSGGFEIRTARENGDFVAVLPPGGGYIVESGSKQIDTFLEVPPATFQQEETVEPVQTERTYA